MAYRALPGYTKSDNFDDDLEEGDLIEINRGVYSHWAVYCGNGEVYHMTGDGYEGSKLASNSFSGAQNKKAVVKKDKLNDVVGKDKYKKSNKLDDFQSAFSPKEILRRAEAKRGPVAYNVLNSNCEHFANWCRYGTSVSKQVTSVKANGAAYVGMGLLFGIGDQRKTSRSFDQLKKSYPKQIFLSEQFKRF